MYKSEGKILEISRICGKCWEEDKIIQLLWIRDGEKYKYHLHKGEILKNDYDF